MNIEMKATFIVPEDLFSECVKRVNNCLIVADISDLIQGLYTEYAGACVDLDKYIVLDDACVLKSDYKRKRHNIVQRCIIKRGYTFALHLPVGWKVCVHKDNNFFFVFGYHGTIVGGVLGTQCGEECNKTVKFGYLSSKFFAIRDEFFVPTLLFKPQISVEQYKKEALKYYLNEKRQKICDAIRDKYGITGSEYQIIRFKYKHLRKMLVNNQERLVFSNSVTEEGLREAGWEFFKSCIAKEPKDEMVASRAEILFSENAIAINKGSKTRYIKIRLECILRVFPTLKNFYIVNDSRVIKYLACSPEYLNVSYEKIIYFKWAIEQIAAK